MPARRSTRSSGAKSTAADRKKKEAETNEAQQSDDAKAENAENGGNAQAEAAQEEQTGQSKPADVNMEDSGEESASKGRKSDKEDAKSSKDAHTSEKEAEEAQNATEEASSKPDSSSKAEDDKHLKESESSKAPEKTAMDTDEPTVDTETSKASSKRPRSQSPEDSGRDRYARSPSHDAQRDRDRDRDDEDRRAEYDSSRDFDSRDDRRRSSRYDDGRYDRSRDDPRMHRDRAGGGSSSGWGGARDDDHSRDREGGKMRSAWDDNDVPNSNAESSRRSSKPVRERKRPRLVLDENEVMGVLGLADRSARRRRKAVDGDEDGAEEIAKERAAAKEADLAREKGSVKEDAAEAPKPAAASADTSKRADKPVRRRPAGMLGLLNSTLSKAREENEKRNAVDAARKRAEIEARLAEKVKKESKAITEISSIERAIRADKLRAFRLAEEIAAGEAEHRSLRAQKRRLASFLVTKGIDLESAKFAAEAVRTASGQAGGAKELRQRAKVDREELKLVRGLKPGKGTSICVDVPSSLPPTEEDAARDSSRSARGGSNPFERAPDTRGLGGVGSVSHNDSATYPIYYLPKKLLPIQEDILDDQEDEVDDAIEDADDEWAQKRQKLEDELETLLEKIRGSQGKKVDVQQEAGLPVPAQQVTGEAGRMDEDGPTPADDAMAVA